MAIAEACSLWIEQRVQEELEAKKGTDTSVRQMCRTIAAEVEKHFETTVSSETIRTKARRIQSGSNDPSKENTVKSEPKPKLEKLEKKKHGGARKGSGRKPKEPSCEFSSASNAEMYTQMVISQLERLRYIPKKERIEALTMVEDWIKKEKER